MGWIHVDQTDFAAGFEAGYRAVKGNAVPAPSLLRSAEQETAANMSPFLMGIREGLKLAGVELKD